MKTLKLGKYFYLMHHISSSVKYEHKVWIRLGNGFSSSHKTEQFHFFFHFKQIVNFDSNIKLISVQRSFSAILLTVCSHTREHCITLKFKY